ncbi:dsDNA nuclease domain-containing protein [Lacticaseibacillus pantheris]|uniref:dsDNA nuclease domain-containing protein n=1 Tax=Lacticaseibacillus pantheris TaxID=171523 RepID=UPI002658E7F1|nr:dsDNA nuclease domain-containing protein [Lacticaseibacillus pantheris]WKF84160.1 hypothetical protein QY874_07625 [Lacticaseibacillus pantheris]
MVDNIKKVNTNAAPTQSGFHFQDFSALYLFLSNIKQTKWINVEGQDDIDIMYVDGSMHFYQAKEVHDTEKQIPAAEFRKSISVLSDDTNSAVNSEQIKDLAIVTNTNRPFGATSEKPFRSEYMKVLFPNLTVDNRKKLRNYLKTAIKKVAQGKKAELQRFDVKRLSVIKIQYFGDDEKSRLQLLYKTVLEILEQSPIPSDWAGQLMETWRLLLTGVTPFPSTKITKQHFISHTEATLLDHPEFDGFFEEFNVSIENEDYIKSQYHSYLEIISSDFSIISDVETSFVEFKADNRGLRHNQLKNKFVNDFSHVIAGKLGLNMEPRNLEIAKLITWSIIKKINMFHDVREVFGVDN